jgi:hypothetical protein
MPQKPARSSPDRLSVSITFSEKERAEFEELARRAREAGQKRSTFAHDLLIAALHFDERQEQLTLLANLEERLEKLSRNQARSTFMILRAAELRDEGVKPTDAKQWVNDVMVLKDL